MNVGFPFQIDEWGRVADPPYPEHVEQLIEQLLFTARGERVNRPDLGAGLIELIFAPLNQEILTVTELQVRAELNRWLGGLIEVAGVQVQARQGSVRVTVDYVLRRNRQRRTATFVHGEASP